MVDIIGAGRVGQALQRRAEEAGVAGVLVSRTAGWEGLEGPAGRPILVTTRNDDLAGAVARVPAHRRADLVFIQNGMIRPLLGTLGLAQATRGILYFAVPARGDDLTVGDPSPFTGPAAQAVVTWLAALGVPANPVSAAAFAEVELEKLLWNCVFGLLCQAKSATVGQVCEAHGEELAALTAELLAVGQEALGTELAPEPLLARMCAYSRSIPTYRGAVKEWAYRNGWFVDLAKTSGHALPVHARLLAEAGVAAG